MTDMRHPLRPARAALALIAGIALSCGDVGAADSAQSAGDAAPGQPRGPVVLVVDGAIALHNAGRSERFDLAMLRALPHRSFTTTTVWTAGPQRFEGVLLRDLLVRLGASGTEIVAHGASDYVSRIPLSDATDPGPIVAYARNGRPMRLRDKGPLWLVYPFDASPDWQTEVVYSRSIWQLDHITVAPAGASARTAGD